MEASEIKYYLSWKCPQLLISSS